MEILRSEEYLNLPKPTRKLYRRFRTELEGDERLNVELRLAVRGLFLKKIGYKSGELGKPRNAQELNEKNRILIGRGLRYLRRSVDALKSPSEVSSILDQIEDANRFKHVSSNTAEKLTDQAEKIRENLLSRIKVMKIQGRKRTQDDIEFEKRMKTNVVTFFKLLPAYLYLLERHSVRTESIARRRPFLWKNPSSRK